MIDFHSHILPEMDDGASSLEMSLEMLKASIKSGVDTVVSTSHYYDFDGNGGIVAFLERRQDRYNTVCNAINASNEEYPRIVLGCEVHLTAGISRNADFDKLALSGTDYILLEMPSGEWNDDIFEEIYQITRLGLKPVMAHIDRYFDKEKRFPDLFSLHPLFQVNAEAFLMKSLRKKLPALFEEDAIHIVGSDMHNMTSRAPNLAEAYAIIEKKFGAEYVDYLKFSSECVLKNENPPIPRLPKLTFTKKIML